MVATSTAESEYVAVAQAAAECLWLRKVLAAIARIDSLPTTNIYEDNAAALKWCHNPVNHAKQKHIHVAFHFVREQITQFRNINVVAVPTEHQWADLFTKSLPAPRFKFLVDCIRGLDPAPLCRTPKDKAIDMMTGCVGKVSDAARAAANAFKRIDMQPAAPVNHFFEQHFHEIEPSQWTHAATAA